MAIKKTTKIKRGGKKVITKTTDTNHFKKGMASVIYAGKKKPIKKKKVVVKDNKRRTKTKTVKYSPINYYGKQTRTVTRTKKKK